MLAKVSKVLLTFANMAMYPQPDRKVLLDIVNTQMPYGKYKDWLLCDIPVHYLEWMQNKDAFPKGKIGDLLRNVLEIKINNLEYILREIKSWRPRY